MFYQIIEKWDSQRGEYGVKRESPKEEEYVNKQNVCYVKES